MHGISLKTKTIILQILMILLATIPLVIYYLNATKGISALGTDPQIERSLLSSIERAPTLAEKEEHAGGLKKYRQIKVLKDRITHQVIIFSIAYSIGVVALSLLIGIMLVSRITKPLRELTEAARHLGKEDDLDYQLEEKGIGGEVSQLIRSFNTMATDLKIARQQRAIAERRATWQHVARTIAHEIKNPLTPIKLSTERMYEKYLNNSSDFGNVIKSTTSTILSEIANLQKLIETFHRYAKFPDPVLNQESLAGIVREAATLFDGSPVKITCSVDDCLETAAVDKNQLKEALSNLIKNALEAIESAGREHGEVKIRFSATAGKQSISISDNGCGISAENQKRLFQPYFTTKKHGNGIGLALTERIVTLNGGKISFESKEGEGTIFRIEFGG